MSEKYPLAEVVWHLGEELRAVQSWGKSAGRDPIVAVTGAKATLEVSITKQADGKLEFGVIGAGGVGVGGALGKETTTTLQVDLLILKPGESADEYAIAEAPAGDHGTYGGAAVGRDREVGPD